MTSTTTSTSCTALRLLALLFLLAALLLLRQPLFGQSTVSLSLYPSRSRSTNRPETIPVHRTIIGAMIDPRLAEATKSCP
jgi:hypothetical protein